MKYYKGENNKERPTRYVVTFLTCLVFGLFGIHRFINKRFFTGLMMLVTLGGFGLFYFYDLLSILLVKFEDNKKNIIHIRVGGFLNYCVIVFTLCYFAFLSITTILYGNYVFGVIAEETVEIRENIAINKCFNGSESSSWTFEEAKKFYEDKGYEVERNESGFAWFVKDEGDYLLSIGFYEKPGGRISNCRLSIKNIDYSSGLELYMGDENNITVFRFVGGVKNYMCNYYIKNIEKSVQHSLPITYEGKQKPTVVKKGESYGPLTYETLEYYANLFEEEYEKAKERDDE